MLINNLNEIVKARFRTAMYTIIPPGEEIDKDKLKTLLEESRDNKVNIRTRREDRNIGNPFIYGIDNIDDLYNKTLELNKAGYEVTINETIDKNDGGVSGVMLGNIIEFAPFSTPRDVETENVCRLPIDMGLKIFVTVYRFNSEVICELLRMVHYAKKGYRIEFSIHPEEPYYTVWQMDKVDIEEEQKIYITENNKFAEMLGSKTFGLLIMYVMLMPVPFTGVFNKYITNFYFGMYQSASTRYWIRPAPRIKQPGVLPSIKGGKIELSKLTEVIPTQLKQSNIEVSYAGSALRLEGGEIIVEGVEGYGDKFMLGVQPPEELPEDIVEEITQLIKSIKSNLEYENIENEIFSVEWGITDSGSVVIFQFNIYDDYKPNWIVRGNKGEIEYIKYNVKDGLENLENVVKSLKDNQGIELIGNVGVTSHFGDILRKYDVPSKIIRKGV